MAHIGDQIALIQQLIEGGHAYPDGSGSVYYRIDSFADYGKLSGLITLVCDATPRLNDGDEYGKESWQDFVLWKAWKPENETDGTARGVPDIRLAYRVQRLSMRYLGESSTAFRRYRPDFSAPRKCYQTEAATGKPFVGIGSMLPTFASMGQDE